MYNMSAIKNANLISEKKNKFHLKKEHFWEKHLCKIYCIKFAITDESWGVGQILISDLNYKKMRWIHPNIYKLCTINIHSSQFKSLCSTKSSKFAILCLYENPNLLFPFFISFCFIFSLMNALVYRHSSSGHSLGKK